MNQYKNLKLEDVMSINPQTIDASAPLREAMAIMNEMNVRHLPVFQEHHAVGVLSERDIIRTIMRYPQSQESNLKVQDAMTREPYCTAPSTPLAEALQIMASNRLGCILVKNKGEKLIGIFTSTDALGLCSQLLGIVR